jgi:hypothetical protein
MRISSKPGPCPFPIKALGAMLAADDDRAVRFVLSALRSAGGNVTAAAVVVGCSVRSLYAWRDSNERLRAGFEKHALGRPGAGMHATEARLAQRADAQTLGNTTKPAGKRKSTAAEE